ncbi:Na(+)/H(+) antiporter subunit F1 [Jeotgalibacillus proteolyticus]|uniref:Na(+)/H(+) antiporter subunit F n=1 Tax=Jeotgalibacillus proteolyticus TaxID=2082395 RepID=A0A2S5GAQ1_9BACL|nr:Na(+)/H(+) antiporter subunit F1 [Jeotgalibacillus proteolyticus]PPA70005.1 Na(+)/H(+) antiporter subunit F [Jeotgalibacillus proteolyticus]
MLDIVVSIALIAVVLSMIGIVYRVIKGPSTADRVIALDSLGISLISVIGLVSILLRTSVFLEVILLLGILAFIGTVAFSKFIEKGEIIQRDRHK